MPVARTVELPARYRVMRHLADGGMASVWEAEDTLLDRHVAVKVLSAPFSDDPSASERFQREARAAARLSHHPHVVTVFDAGEHEGNAFLVMALYRGGTVAERIKSGPIPRWQAVQWLWDAADALDAAHAEGVVHRDVKPGNLLLDERDRVAVGDFGIATAAWASSMTQTGLVLGTAPYLSPEQRMGRTAGPASDRFALAVVAHELLTGRRLEDGVDPALGDDAVAVLSEATALEPDDRPPLARSFVEDLAKAIGDPTSPATAATRRVASDVGTDAHDAAPAQRFRRGAAAAGAAAAGAAAGSAAADVPTGAHHAPGVPRPRREEPTSAHHAPVTPRPPRAAPAAAPPPDERPPSAGAARRGWLPLALLAVLALVAGGLAAALQGGGDDGSGGERASTSSRANTAERARTSTAQERAQTQAPATQAAPPAAAAPPQEEEQAPAETPEAGSTGGGSPSPAEARRLNDQGFQRLQSGDAAGAVPLLEQAVKGLEQTPGDITYAYALYNLGKAYNEAGRPQDAIPVLERRLEVNSQNQPGAVKAELKKARKAAGQE